VEQKKKKQKIKKKEEVLDAKRESSFETGRDKYTVLK
tara:strand:- start:154 stop:264 length:111 start_codon:yes stop_codon:yes gene_type:complete